MKYVHPIRNKETIEAFKQYLKSKQDRDYILLMLGLNTGLRVSDILTLRVRDVETDYIRLKEKKTDKERRIPINRELKKALTPYLKGKEGNEYLLKSRQKDERGEEKAIHRTTAYRIIKEAANHVGFKDNCGTHTMRKTFGYMHYQKYGNAATLQKIFNHDKEMTTLVYIGVEQDFIDDTILGLNL